MTLHRKFVKPKLGELAEHLALVWDWIVELDVKRRYPVAELEEERAIPKIIDVLYLSRTDELQVFSDSDN